MTPLGIYIHWPYCARICPYCDFNVYKSKGDDGDGLTAAILADLSNWREMSGPRTVPSVHFGGGTPSLMRADQIADILTHIDTLWGLPKDAEIALEANPADCGEEKWTAYASAGIERLSLGVQSFDDSVLERLGRDHDEAQALKALGVATKIFPRVSVDLIFGHAGQTPELWARDLNLAIESGAGHISAYQLTIEDKTAFGRAKARGTDHAVDGDYSAQLYDQTRTTLMGAGFAHYEVSNYACPDQESRHNTLYWHGEDYVGVGPGAHGRITTDNVRAATVAHMKPDAYIEAVSHSASGIVSRETLSPSDWAQEYLMMGLRVTGGISRAGYQVISGRALPQAVLSDLSEMGLLTVTAQRVAATANGRLVLDAISRQLLLTQ